ncbi:MAG TPA: ATP-binding protein [Ktedonobacterales bacterium]|nr:ATP-binding protein [Ktedonobacterales bacterium]
MLLNSKRIYTTKRLKTRPTFKTLLPYHGTGGADLLAALPWQAAILDQEGSIIAVNEAWRRFAAEDGAATFPESGLGLNYFDVSRPAFGPHEDAAQQAYQGIREVLAGQRSLFTLDYPYCSRVSPTSERWFQLTATPLANGLPGALIQRLDITAHKHKLDKAGREKTLGSAYAISPQVSHQVRGIDPYQQPRRPLDGLLAMAHALTTPTAQAGSADAYTVAHTLAEQAIAMFGCETVSILALDAKTQTPQPIAIADRGPYIELAWQKRYGRMTRFGDRFDSSLTSRLYRDEVIVLEADPSSKYAQASWLLAPMRSMGRLLGIVRLDYGVRAHPFTAEELSLARAMARMAALVVEQRNLQGEREQAIRERAEATTRELSTREAAQRMELFIALAGHEFRTPLTVLQGQLYLAERKLSASISQGDQTSALASLRESLDAAQRAAGRLGSLADDLLSVTHARTGRLVIHPEWCDLVTLVRDLVADQRQLYPSRHLRLRMGGQRHIYIQADPVRLAQVLTNYLNNACKYSPDSRPIRVDLRVGEGTARISVRDQGPGLAPTVQAQVWERFYQAPDIQPQSGSDVGLGLGLYISRLIVEQHGGEVGVESAVGKGATFWCTVPLRMEAS